MKARWLLIAVMTSCAFGQQFGIRYDGNNTTAAKNVPPGAQAAVYTLPFSKVTVCSYPATPAGSVCTNTVPIYSDQELSSGNLIPQPLVADSEGRFGFWIATGTYSYSVQTSGGTYVGTFPLTLTSPQGPQGPAGAGCGAGPSQCIIGSPTTTQTITQPANTDFNVITSGTGAFQHNGNPLIDSVPSGNQTITQPPGTTLTVNSFNNVLYASQCSGADIGAKIQDCWSKLPIDPTEGHHIGTIILPNTKVDTADATWSTTVHISSGVSLIGTGITTSVFNCTASVCLFTDNSDPQFSQTPYSFMPFWGDTYSDFTIDGNNSSGQDLILMWDRNHLTMKHVYLDDSHDAGGSCVHMDTHNYWTERNEFLDVTTGYDCHIGFRLTNSASNPNALPSFGYNRFLDIRMNPTDQSGYGSYGFSVENKAYFYNSFIRAIANAAGGTYSELFHLQDQAVMLDDTLNIDGEGPLKYVVNESSASNGFVYYGHLNLCCNVSNFAAGSYYKHYIDDGGNSADTPSLSHNGYESETAVSLASGYDLNLVTNCGTFVGNGLQNAPAEIGSSFAIITVQCTTGTPYLNQTIYQMESTGLVPHVWHRVRDNNTWGSWIPAVMGNQMPSYNANHVVCMKSNTPYPVVLGYCSTQPDASGSCTCN